MEPPKLMCHNIKKSTKSQTLQFYSIYRLEQNLSYTYRKNIFYIKLYLLKIIYIYIYIFFFFNLRGTFLYDFLFL